MNRFPFRIISALLTLIVSVPMMFSAATTQLGDSFAAQKVRMDALRKSYADGTYEKIDESRVTGYDLPGAIENGVRFNEVSFIGTHNSYQLAASEPYTKVYESLSTLTFGLVCADRGRFSSETLTDQFNMGIRSVELDIETKVKGEKISFVCAHEPALNMNSSCADFALALEEIRLWSENNPGHLPITVIIEPKKAFLQVDGLRHFSLEYVKQLDVLLRQALGDRLLTPADVIGKYESFGEMRKADAWPLLSDTLGKVMVLLHDTTVTDAYIARDKSIRTQAMFPMLRYKDRDENFASFLIINEPGEALDSAGEVIAEKKLIVRTRADNFGTIKDKNRKNALGCGVQIVSTDYPPRVDGATKDNLFTFAGGATVTRSGAK